MGHIKFYTIEDWITAYLKEWGYSDENTQFEITQKLKSQKSNLHPDDISTLLNEHLLIFIHKILPESSLSDIQKLNYFKMVFLSEKLYEKCQLFQQISTDEEKMLIKCFQKHLYQIAPNIIQANMFRQSIKTFHPFWKIKKTFVKSIKLITNFRKKA